MSSYRPKSLDELNSQYDQAMSADRAIKKGVSGIKENENQQKEIRAAADRQALDTPTESLAGKVSSPRSVEDISGAVDDFIRHLNHEYAPEAFSPRPQKSTPVQPQPPVHKPAAAPAEPAGDERSELLDDYMKVMTDQYEDDDELSDSASAGSHRKKIGRKRRREKNAPAAVQEPVQPDRSEPLPLPEVDYDAADYMAQNGSATPDSRQDDEDAVAFDSFDTAFDRLDEQSEIKPKKKKGRIVLRTLFSLLLAGVIAVTAAVASLVLVFKVNTGSAVFDRYYFVTTSDAFEEANLRAGDLVICIAEDSVEDGRFVLCVDRDAGSFFLGKKNGAMIDDEGNKMQLVNGQAVYEENVLGRVKRSFGHVGRIIDFIFRYYIPILSILLICAIGLIVIVAVALRNKEKGCAQAEEGVAEAEEAAFGEDEDRQIPEEIEQPDLEDPQEEEETELHGKSKKKKRKKDKNARRAAEDDNAGGEEESDAYGSDYDSYSEI